MSSDNNTQKPLWTIPTVESSLFQGSLEPVYPQESQCLKRKVTELLWSLIF